MTQILRVTLVYEYEVHPEHYPNGDDPMEMAKTDIEVDPTIILDAEWHIESASFQSENQRLAGLSNDEYYRENHPDLAEPQ